MTHCQTEHSVAKGRLGLDGDKADGDGDKPRTYKMSFLTKAEPRPCPVKGCSGRASTRTEMRVQFWHRNVRDIVVILEEGNIPHPWFPPV